MRLRKAIVAKDLPFPSGEVAEAHQIMDRLLDYLHAKKHAIYTKNVEDLVTALPTTTVGFGWVLRGVVVVRI